MIKKKNINKILIFFLFSHLLIWTLVPSFSNPNLPLDTIEALAWGSNLEWGFAKHPPASAFFVEIFYQIFRNNDWAYYFLSQIFIVTAFFIVWKFSNIYFNNKIYSLIAVLALEGIFFYNYTTPEFNVYICETLFWALTVYFSWLSFKTNENINWILLGVFAGIGFLSHYLFIYLLASITIFFILTSIHKNNFNKKYLISLFVFFVVIFPHLIWLHENNYITIDYALKRTELKESTIFDHIKFPFLFVLKQIGILIPFWILLAIILKTFKMKINIRDNKKFFLLVINFLPLILMFFTSLVIGAKIKTMWMTPFYLFFGLFFIYFLEKKIIINNLKKFLFVFLFLFILSPSLYLYVSLSNDLKRTDYPGKDISYLVQTRWDKNFRNKIAYIVGDEWLAGNLSYHLSSRPKWINNLNPKLNNLTIDGGVIYVGNAKILKSICPGEFGSIKRQGICMIGARW